MKMFGMKVIVSEGMPDNAFMIVNQREGPPPSFEAISWQDGRMKHYSGPLPSFPPPKIRSGT